jgi:hypothetical protein
MVLLLLLVAAVVLLVLLLAATAGHAELSHPLQTLPHDARPKTTFEIMRV